MSQNIVYRQKGLVMSEEKTMLERDAAKSRDPEVYSRGYFDGYHKGYADVKSKVNAAKKKEREEYRKKLESIEAISVYPLSMIYELTDGFDYGEPIRISPETIYQTMTEVLSERDRRLMEMYYRDRMSLDEIAGTLYVTRERVRQIILKAGRKLVHPSVMCKMRVVSLKEYDDLKRKYDLLYAQVNGTLPKDITNRFIEDLDLSVRSYNALKRNGIQTVGELFGLSDEELSKFRNLGDKSKKEIKTKLYDFLDPEGNNERTECNECNV